MPTTYAPTVILHDRTYADPADAGDRYHLPTMVIEYDGRRWSMECCMPGCMPEGDALTFDTPTAVVEYAYESADQPWAAFFRQVFQGAVNRLRGNIAIALADESRAEALRAELCDVSEDGADHVEELAHACARAVFSVHPNR